MNWEKIEKQLIKLLESENQAYSHTQGTLNILKKFQLWEDLIDIKFEKWSQYLIMDLFKNGVTPKKESVVEYEREGIDEDKLTKLASGLCNTSYFTFSSRIRYANKITNMINRTDLNMNISDFKVTIEADTQSIFTKEEMIDICDCLANAQDKFIFYALFSGIRGNKYSDLVELKQEDINFETKEIKLKSGIVIKMDEYLEDILNDVLDPEFGQFYYKLNRSGEYDLNDSYRFNMDSPYVLKVKPTTTNGRGMNPMSYQGIQTRLKGLASVLDRKISGRDLYKSGVIYHLHTLHPDRKNFTQTELKAFLNGNNYDMSVVEAKRTFEGKYGNN